MIKRCLNALVCAVMFLSDPLLRVYKKILGQPLKYQQNLWSETVIRVEIKLRINYKK